MWVLWTPLPKPYPTAVAERSSPVVARKMASALCSYWLFMSPQSSVDMVCSAKKNGSITHISGMTSVKHRHVITENLVFNLAC